MSSQPVARFAVALTRVRRLGRLTHKHTSHPHTAPVDLRTIEDRMQVRAAITRGDVEAALAGIERIDPQVGLWVDELGLDSPVSTRGVCVRPN